MNAVYSDVCARFTNEVASGQVELHRLPSSVAMTSFPDGALDYVYIDGDHAYDAVLGDLELAGPQGTNTWRDLR